jgi:ribosomal protein S12 methylthiotransferase accessory factor
MRSGVSEIADWAIASSLVDGVLFSHNDGGSTLPICSVAQVRGVRGFGKGESQGAALVSALGEAVERYSATQVTRTSLIWASLRELGESAFDPRWLCLYSEQQYRRPGFPYRPFDEDEGRHWIPGRWIDTGEGVYLPAAAVYLNDALAAEEFCQTTSNGLAAGSSVEDAAQRATLELRERDAFVVSWISCRGADKVTSPLPQVAGQIAERLEDQGARLETYLVASGAPAFVAVSLGLGDGERWPAATLGLGAGTTEEEAIAKAFLEHGQTGPFLADLWRSGTVAIPRDRQAIRTLRDHALYYCDSIHRWEFDRWLENARRKDGAKEVTPGRNARIAIVDLTPPELMDGPFRVARALARGLQPIYCGHGFERIYTEELQSYLAGTIASAAPLPIC